MRKAEIDFSRYAMAAAALGSVAAASTASADFSAPYALNPPANGTYNNQPNGATFGAWTVIEPITVGNAVNTSAAPGSLTISMSTSVTGPTRTFDLVTTAFATGLVSFDWSANLSATFGTASAAFVLNGVPTNLATRSGPPAMSNGSFSMAINAGDSFGFRVAHNYLGSSALTISNFAAPVPEPSIIGLVAVGGTALFLLRERRRRARN